MLLIGPRSVAHVWFGNPLHSFSNLCKRISEPTHTSGVDLTFATHLAASSRSECQIQNSTRNLYLLMVFRFKHSQKIPAEMGSECLNRTTRQRLKRIGRFAQDEFFLRARSIFARNGRSDSIYRVRMLPPRADAYVVTPSTIDRGKQRRDEAARGYGLRSNTVIFLARSAAS